VEKATVSRLRGVLGAVVGRRSPHSPFLELAAIAGSHESDDAPTIGVLVYRGVSSGEVDEPVRRLATRMCANVVLVGPSTGRVHAVEPSRPIEVGFTPATVPPIDVLVVPGGLGWKQVADDVEIMSWLREVAGSVRGILAISTGSLLLASVGRLDGRLATGHWLAEDDLAAFGARVSSTRTASDDAGRLVTASGALAAVQVVDDLADHARWAEWMPEPNRMP
jgi:transcriptional regulator GlxA family with amidase domain